MSREVGMLQKLTDEKTGQQFFTGELLLEQMSGDVRLVPNPRRRTDHAPDWLIKIIRNGRWVEIGAAWNKSAKGQEYLSLTVDAPGMGNPIYCAAFEIDGVDDESYRIVWGRPPEQVTAGKPVDDEIPWA